MLGPKQEAHGAIFYEFAAEPKYLQLDIYLLTNLTNSSIGICAFNLT